MSEEPFVILSDALLALLLNRKKKPSDDELLSGSCTEFEIKAAETEARGKKRRFGIF